MEKIECRSKYHVGDRMVPADDMVKDKSRKSGYSPHCKQCRKVTRLANIEERNQKDKEYYQRNKEKLKEQFRQRYKDNPKTNAGDITKRRARDAKRRACLRNANVGWANSKIIQKVYEEAERISDVTGIEHQVDHIIPLQNELVCGLHCEDNLQILTGKENRYKKNKFTPF